MNLTLKPNKNKLPFYRHTEETQYFTTHKDNHHMREKEKRESSDNPWLQLNWYGFSKSAFVSFSLIGLFYGYVLTQSVELVLWKNISCEKFSYTFLLYKGRLQQPVRSTFFILLILFHYKVICIKTFGKRTRFSLVLFRCVINKTNDKNIILWVKTEIWLKLKCR